MKRYAGADELADDLRAFREGRPIKAHRAGRTERLGRWLKRRKEVAYLVGGALAAACISLLVLALWGRLGAKPNPPPIKADAVDRFAGLPDDLHFVPQDAFGFVSLRVGDLWELAATREKPFSGQQPPGLERLEMFNDLDKLGASIQEHLSIHPRNVERVTAVLLDDGPSVLIGKNPLAELNVLAIVRLSKPCDPKASVTS